MVMFSERELISTVSRFFFPVVRLASYTACHFAPTGGAERDDDLHVFLCGTFRFRSSANIKNKFAATIRPL